MAQAIIWTNEGLFLIQNTTIFTDENEFENVIGNTFCLCISSWGPSDTIWHWRSWSTLVQVMACCLTAPSHYLNQCWLIISKVLWHSSEDIIIRRFEDTNQQSKIENYIFKITLRSPRGQWVNVLKGKRVHILWDTLCVCQLCVSVNSSDMNKQAESCVCVCLHGCNPSDK